MSIQQKEPWSLWTPLLVPLGMLILALIILTFWGCAHSNPLAAPDTSCDPCLDTQVFKQEVRDMMEARGVDKWILERVVWDALKRCPAK